MSLLSSTPAHLSKLQSLQARLRPALEQATRELLAARSSKGYWVGELSSSALSTATAACALAVVQRETGSAQFRPQIAAGLNWLSKFRNQDGGWGDTTLSLSNLSTTVLCWAAFGAVPGADQQYKETVAGAEQWLLRQTGSLEHSELALAVIQRYGKDRTFSVPILTLAALAGRLGRGPEAWRHVIPLPFELAACPHQLFAALRLPVVSYALPALIAIGQARHHHRPSRNPLVRGLRTLARGRTLQVLQAIQPVNGGFLEATPLTSFVTLSLAGSGQASHPVCAKGIDFLLNSQRPDGSWPIDTNLATWLTTLSVNALADGPLNPAEQSAIRSWLLAQQYRHEHPYTHAAPGAWAWTDLPGGVPDADDTAGALLALRKLGPVTPESREAAIAAINWLLALQNKDGGIPTFCRGWGTLPFDRSSADLTAHALRAWFAWQKEMPDELRERLLSAIPAGLSFLGASQRADGAWVPLWFGNQHSPGEENPTYGTTRVLCALAEALRAGSAHREMDRMFAAGLRWLFEAQNQEGSWGGSTRSRASVEETALAVEALAAAASGAKLPAEIAPAAMLEVMNRGAGWLAEKIESGAWKQPSPIGLYFAKLWYYERLYPLIYTVNALSRVSRLGLHGPARGD